MNQPVREPVLRNVTNMRVSNNSKVHPRNTPYLTDKLEQRMVCCVMSAFTIMDAELNEHGEFLCLVMGVLDLRMGVECGHY